jgi:hypothetical protein
VCQSSREAQTEECIGGQTRVGVCQGSVSIWLVDSVAHLNDVLGRASTSEEIEFRKGEGSSF